MSKYNLRPCGNYYSIEILEDKEKILDSGLVLPDQARQKSQIARVVAKGPGAVGVISGTRIEMEAKPGELVVINKFAVQEIELPDNSKVVIISEGDIFAILEERVEDEPDMVEVENQEETE